MKKFVPKVAFSTMVLAVFFVRKIWPTLLDTNDLVILAVALVPWIASAIKSLELPGGFKVELKDIQTATEKATSGSTAPQKEATAEPAFRIVAETDPNLALVELRIEIEKRIRTLAQKHGIDASRKTIMRLLSDLRRQGVLAGPVLSGFEELVMFGNQAAHGAEVDPRAADWALDQGPSVLAVLDTLVTEHVVLGDSYEAEPIRRHSD